MLEVKDLCKRLVKKNILSEVAFDIQPGEVVALLGRNGSGKSTLLNIVSGQMWPTSGLIRLAGRDVTRDSMQISRSIGYLGDRSPVYAYHTVHDYLLFSALLHGLSKKQGLLRVAEVSQETGLSDVLDIPTQQLSHGYLRRLGLAQAIVHQPQLIVLDEPLNGLDPLQIEYFHSLVKRLGQSYTVIFSTHSIFKISEVCTRVLFIDRGQLTIDFSFEKNQADKTFMCRVSGSQAALDAVLDEYDWRSRTLVQPESASSWKITVRQNQQTTPTHFCRQCVLKGLGVNELNPMNTNIEPLLEFYL